ncbi:MAG: endonuclease, partial [Adhaeribacter sp.]|nr:endonuclease [Adhaeribacter sp.]
MYYRTLPPTDPELLRTLTERQKELSQQVIVQPPDFTLRTLAGCDSSFIGENILSVFVVLRYPELDILEIQYNYA